MGAAETKAKASGGWGTLAAAVMWVRAKQEDGGGRVGAAVLMAAAGAETACLRRERRGHMAARS